MRTLVLYAVLFAISILLVPVTGWGQGWARIYNFGKNEIGRRGIETQNDEFVVAATQNEFMGADKAVRLSRMDGQGQLIWSKPYPVPGIYDIVFLHERVDGSIILLTVENDSAITKHNNVFWIFSGVGDLLEKKTVELPDTDEIWISKVDLLQDTLLMAGIWEVNGVDKPLLFKVSLNGDLLWYRKFQSFLTSFLDLEHDQDNHLWVVNRRYTVDSWWEWELLKLDQQGNTLLTVPLSGGNNVPQYRIKSSGDAILVAGATKVFPNIHSSLKKIDLQGNTIVTAEFELPFSAEEPVLCTTSDGGAGLAVYYYTGNFPQNDHADISLIRFDQNLNQLWYRNYYRGYYNNAYDIVQTASGGFLLTGTTDFNSNLFVIRTDSLGYSITNLIQGRVQWDTDKDCAEQPSDYHLKEWIVVAVNAADTFYRSTGADGQYSIQADTGRYIVQVHPRNSLWDANCVVLDTVITGIFDTIHQNFSVIASVDYPGMEVSTAVWGLRPCFPSNLQVWYCNNGTVTAENAQIQLVLNEHMTYDSASLAPSLVSGDTVWFNLGDVEPFECGHFFVRVQIDCDTTLLGQTLCYTAHAFPDTSCLSPAEWSGAQVVATAFCEGDSVRLVLHNIGSAPTTNGLEYIIVEDNVILMQAPFNLPPDGILELKVPANGSTWRLIAEQEPGFPNGFFTTVALEGCETGGNFSTGFINQFDGGDAAPWLDAACRLVTSSYDPNDKSAVPEGYGEQHFVAANTDLEYLIRFQNTGTDTAFRVVIRDQISSLLDPASVQPGAASHPYTWSLSGTGELTFTFDPIALPDSTNNLTGSQGFVQFRIAQRPDLPQGARLENQAAIYFDFNAPVLTNTVFHTIQPLFKPTSGVETPVFNASERLKIWPNPAGEVAYVSFKDRAMSPRKLSLYDLNGQLVAVTYSSDNTVAVQRGGLPAGVFLVKIETGGGKTEMGAVVFR